MNSDEFKNYAVGIQSLIFSLGIMCAGIWAVYVYSSKENKSIDIRLSAIQMKNIYNHKYVINAVMQIQNDGNQILIIPLGDKALRATRIKFSDTGKVETTGETFFSGNYSFIYGGAIVNFMDLTLDPGESRKVEFLLKVDNPGLYLLETNSKNKVDKNLYWNSMTYINIE